MNTDNLLKCLLIDADEGARNNLRALIENNCDKAEIVGEANDKNSFIHCLENLKPDLVIMDIELKSQTTFDILNHLDEISFKIIFVCTHGEYAIEGYKYGAVDYLLKPVSASSINKAINNAYNKKAHESINLEVKEIEKPLYALPTKFPKIAIADAKGLHLIKIADIMYCAGDGNYTTFVMQDNTQIVISKNLKQFEEKLMFFQFYRVHRSYLININYINLLNKEYGGSLVMENGETLPIARNRKKELLQRVETISVV